MKLFWATDIHLDCVLDPQKQFFYNKLNNIDILVISGDISNGKYLKKHLLELDDIAKQNNFNIYFVLGNHDFWYDSIENKRKEVLNFKLKNSYYLTKIGIVELNNSIALIGHDGWWDTKNGIPGKIIMNDFTLIKDFFKIRSNPMIPNHNSDEIINLEFKKLAQLAANHFEKYLTEAFLKYKKVILITHVAPFVESAFYKGKMSNKYWQPYFSSKTEGDVLLKIMDKYKNNELIILCGHSHGKSQFKPLPNLTVLTGEAFYGNPDVKLVDV